MFSFVGCVLGTVVLWKMYQARNVLEIRARWVQVFRASTFGVSPLSLFFLNHRMYVSPVSVFSKK